MPPRESGACDTGAWDFARAEEVWSRFEPLTPAGKDFKEARLVLADRAVIEAAYDETEMAARAAERIDQVGRDRLKHYLGRAPRLPEAILSEATSPASLGETDLFVVKKFLACYRGAIRLLGAETRERFGLGFESDELAGLLELGGADEESFYLADAYDAELGPIRARIRELDAAARALRGSAEASVRELLGLDFRGRAFVVIERGAAMALLERDACEGELPQLVVEAQDGQSCYVRIAPSAKELELAADRASALAAEREVENRVILAIARAILAEAERLEAYERALTSFDIALGRARMAEELGLRRPRLDAEELVVEGGRLIPCEAECRASGRGYTPLDLRLTERAALVFGSNMGGKTVALQTLVCLQLLAQAGMFVPAALFETRVYGRIVYAGAPLSGGAEEGRRDDGLSGFGREVAALQRAWVAASGTGAFVALDEPGRTTSSEEAQAIVAAAAESFSALPSSFCIIATHFRGTARSERVARLRTGGLDREAARLALAGASVGSPERLAAISSLMRYDIAREGAADEGSGRRRGSDAIEVAALLGLDDSMLDLAREYYGREES